SGSPLANLSAPRRVSTDSGVALSAGTSGFASCAGASPTSSKQTNAVQTKRSRRVFIAWVSCELRPRPWGSWKLHIPREPQIVSELHVLRIANDRRFRSRSNAAPTDGHHRTTAEQRRDIELHALHESPVKGLSQNTSAPFDHHARDLAPAQFAQDGVQRFA